MKDFGELIMMFSSLANDDTTSDLVIKPEYYITENVQHVCEFSCCGCICTILDSAWTIVTKAYFIDLPHEAFYI